MKLNIVTPVTRLQNLPAIRESIKQQLGKGIDIEWWVIFDASCPAPDDIPGQLPHIENHAQATISGMAGHCHRNTFLMQQELRARLESPGILEEWIYCIDDDNILHPDLVPWLIANLNVAETATMLVFDQQMKDGSIRLYAGVPKVNHVDTAQFMWRGTKSVGVRFREDLYNADGYFSEDIDKRDLGTTIVNQPLCYYNYLRS